MKVVEMMKSFWKEEEGLAMIEYAIIAAVITGGAILAFQTLGTSVNTRVTAVSDQLAP